jgi:CRP/FNR family transcriptional regulator, cyclic AMP receptor protein
MGPSPLKLQTSRARKSPRVERPAHEFQDKGQGGRRTGKARSGLLTMRSAAERDRSRFEPNLESFPVPVAVARKFLAVRKKGTIFSQGDRANSVFYIRKGRVRLTVLSRSGKEAAIGILGEGYFLGEGSLAGQVLRMSTAAAMTDCELLEMDKKEMMKAVLREPALSELFVKYLLTRNIRYEADLVDHLFNYTEKRLARILLLLSHFGKDGRRDTIIPKISQETIAELIGTSRSRVNFFMSRFKKFGFIHYNGGLQVHSSLLTVFLHD